MRRFASLLPLLIMSMLGCTAHADSYQDAVASPTRPATDRENDDRRKPAEVMAFAGVSEGDTVIEIGAGQGYTTELTSILVGPSGKVYAHGLDPARVIGNRLPNVVLVPSQPKDFGSRFELAGIDRNGVDIVLAFFSLHDGYLNDKIDMQTVYRAVYEFLKPGGAFVVLDNTARAGSGIDDTPALHRIDPEYLRNEILKAGFEFVAESELLRNPDDDLQSDWGQDTDKRRAGYQDRFAFLFQKPD